ncbi:MAG: pyridoxamine 5'-phosphate oxidase family protein [Desulfobacterales bacterium]|nr:pyridoxamine 5'-phosphate oxidase family protein [Desulfobacterales bacterium]
MRRKDKQIDDPAVIESIIRRSLVCRLAMTDGLHPYVVPISFGYRGRCLYFHSAGEGKKIELLRENPRVCFEFDCDLNLKKSDRPCRWGMKFKSVVGFGTARFIEDPAQKREALSVIMAHYAGERFELPDEEIRRTTVFCVKIEQMTGKQSE